MDEAADPGGPSSPLPTPSGGWRSWVLVVAIFLGVFALTATTVTDWRYHPTRGGAVYLPPDGYRSFQGPLPADTTNEGQIRENAIITGAGLGSALPDAVDTFARTAGVDLGLDAWRLWWRSTTTQLSDASSSTRLFGYSTLGMVQVLTWDDTTAEAFLPALPVLPATGQLGSVWTREGQTVSLDQSVTPYALKGTFSAATDPAYAGRGCAASRLELTRGSQPAEVERLVFCPGAGLVDRLLGDQVRTANGPVTLPVPRTDPAPSPSWTPSSWVLNVTTVDSVRWPEPKADLVPIGAKAIAVTASGTLISVRGDTLDLSGLVRDGSGSRRVLGWTARPGGRILSVTTVGDLVVATTEDRSIVAYDHRGRFAWQGRLAEVSHTGAQALGDGLILVTSKSGHLDVRRAVDGTVVWAADVRGAPTGDPAVDVANGRFYVGDDSGTVTAFGRQQPEPLWTAEVGGRQATLAATPSGVVLRSGDEVMLLVDGERRWTSTTPGGGGVDVFADVVVVGGGGQAGTTSRALELSDGSQRWSRPGVITRAVSGDVMIMAESRGLVAVDPYGAVLARVEVPEVEPSSVLYPVLTASGDGVGVWSQNLPELTIWSPPS